MLVSILTGVYFGMEIDVPTERRNLGGKHPRHAGGSHRTYSVSLGDMSYEAKVREPLKSHLTMRMVTSSLKSSPQKSAAALWISRMRSSADSEEPRRTVAERRSMPNSSPSRFSASVTPSV